MRDQPAILKKNQEQEFIWCIWIKEKWYELLSCAFQIWSEELWTGLLSPRIWYHEKETMLRITDCGISVIFLNLLLGDPLLIFSRCCLLQVLKGNNHRGSAMRVLREGGKCSQESSRVKDGTQFIVSYPSTMTRYIPRGIYNYH